MFNKYFMHIMDLSKLFERLLALPKFFDEIHQYMESLNGCDESIYNIVQTSFWKKKVAACNLNDDEFAIPLFVYYDDFEPLNALGSHSSAYKLGGVYVNIPCIPPHVQAQLQFIFLAMLFFTSDSADMAMEKFLHS